MLNVASSHFDACAVQPGPASHVNIVWMRWIFLPLVGIAACLPSWELRAEDAQIDFNRDVRPIFNAHCTECHGGVKQAGDLSFVYAEQALAMVEPGEADSSYLMERITAEDESERMPPADHGRPLSNEEVATLSAWIDQGAHWGVHWAFEKPVSSQPPKLEDDNWSLGRIDQFVMARLRSEGLEPAAPASPERWLRRVALDLTGLPPSPSETKDFLAELERGGDNAYQQQVDRLLKSPAFGERWASVWLDAVRYADSRGLGQDGRRTMWSYRDWVIRALNQDMPYDQFTVRQLAGDLLLQPTIDDLVATACHRLTQTNEEGGTDDEQFRVEAVVDRINTTWQAWQGLSFGCVQCHAHPYDPIMHEEYYQFMAFFNNTYDCDLTSDKPDLAVPLEREEFAQARELDRKISKLQQSEWRKAVRLLREEKLWTAMQDAKASTNNTTKVQIVATNGTEECQTVGTVAKETTVSVQWELPASFDSLTGIRFKGLPADVEKARLQSEWGFVLSHVKVELLGPDGASQEVELASVIPDEPAPLLDPQQSLDPKSKTGFGAYSRINYPRSALFVCAQPVELGTKRQIRVSLRQDIFELGAFPLVADRVRLDATSSTKLTGWYGNTSRQAARARLAKLQRRRDAIKSVRLPIMTERPKHLARPTFVFDRGNFLSPLDVVQPTTPEFLPALYQQQRHQHDAASESVPSRLDMAKWIASADNPLTARVMVNRLWGQLFGTGIVETQEDFGSSGAAPSHQGLLDDLAVRFQGPMQWSVKQLLREMVLSATYRQSAQVTAEKRQADPRNRLLSRGPRSRLPAETVRDQALAISGLLNETLYGPPVYPPIPDGVWNPFQASDKWATAEKDDPNRYRRTIYTYTKRTIPFPILASFDAPARDFCAMRRLPSNTPLQALMTLNDTTFIEAGAALAQRMQTASNSLDEQLAYGWVLATCRQPTKKELQELRRLFDSVQPHLQESDVNEDTAELDSRAAALESVASVLLNLDEVLTK